MQTASVNQNGSEVLKIKSLNGTNDYPIRRQNMRFRYVIAILYC